MRRRAGVSTGSSGTRRGVLGTVFAAALLLGACGRGGPAEPDASAAVDVLRVLTYNIHHGEGADGVLDLERIAGVINGASADLVALQEVDQGAVRTGGVDQAAELGRLTGMHHAFAPFMEFDGGRYGLAILSKHPIQSTQVIALPTGRHEPRTALAAEVMIPGRASVTFVCAHLDWLESDTERFAQAEALARSLEEDPGVVLAGDFNDVPGSRTMVLFGETFTDAVKRGDGRATYPSDRPREEIDFVMYRPGYAFVGGARVLGEEVASDHRPVLATLEWVWSK
ncbi:MAG TPA: endonuclease/exonuclease/phosphatase family protein [Phycisphaerales bacterium]|nr:endonuclease/exonuclease/phosphatase family protein [Phycisphaerales bacterium]